MNNSFKNADGKDVLLGIVAAIQKNREYLGDIDGLIGDGDHGMNMNKGFSLFGERFQDEEVSFAQGLDELGMILLNEIGGSMGPIYGTVFMSMGEAGEDAEDIDICVFGKMLRNGLTELQDIVDAQVGDKTLVDTLTPAVSSIETSAENNVDFADALQEMKTAALEGRDSTKDMIAKFGRSSRLGERSRGVLDAGATSCYIILEAMADGMIKKLS